MPSFLNFTASKSHFEPERGTLSYSFSFSKYSVQLIVYYLYWYLAWLKPFLIEEFRWNFNTGNSDWHLWLCLEINLQKVLEDVQPWKSFVWSSLLKGWSLEGLHFIEDLPSIHWFLSKGSTPKIFKILKQTSSLSHNLLCHSWLKRIYSCAVKQGHINILKY